MSKGSLHIALSFDEELLSFSSLSNLNDFVAISAAVGKNGRCEHSGLVICFDKQIHYFHFDGRDVLLEEITERTGDYDNLYFKKTKIIHEADVVSFLGHCQKLKARGVKPQYGFVFNGSYYDSKTGENFLVNAEYDITTCVGFCIKVIRGFLYNNEEYLKLADWELPTFKEAPTSLIRYMFKYLKKYADENGINISDLFKSDELKRISPSELLSSAFFKNLPIQKNSIDSINPELEAYFLSLVAA
ncbi:hypothetical protein [Croceivirga thetidis]|uniref:3'-5' exonuclease n=1 Tax=Croceivirga thetidis TaxID=2721623 RepID=A0ABX1GNN9_9FLAO|nr:hypothetical protein [Croceivirga thetidis]NKI31259.1 hypothetical protein [Croceivirga thetidis]